MKKRRGFEGSAADRKQDARGAKKLGLSLSDYEKSPQDEQEDRLGRRAGPPKRGPGRPAAPPYEMSPNQERNQRLAGRKANMAPPLPDADDMDMD